LQRHGRGDDEGLAEDGNVADRTVNVFKLDPMLVFWGGPIRQVSDVAEDGERLGTGREILARSGANVEYCEGNPQKNQECR
jgi:hypothetical protein